MSSASDLLSIGLRRVQDRFSRTIDDSLKVQCLLIESPIVGDESDSSQPPGFVGREFLSFYTEPYRHILRSRDEKSRLIDAGANRTIYLFGTDKADDGFSPLATDAGNLLSAIPENAFPVIIPADTLRTTTPAIRWIYFLFDLAWAKVPGSALRPSKDKTAWAGRTSVSLASLPQVRARFKDLAERFLDPPTWYSTIDDLVQASIYAIDILMIPHTLAPPPAGATSGTEVPANGPPPPLGERAQLVLKVLLDTKTFDSDHRQRTEDIAVAAIGRGADANQFKEVIAGLKKIEYVDTKEGRGGGCWLTTSGRQRAEKL
jgi:hypothetical protein